MLPKTGKHAALTRGMQLDAKALNLYDVNKTEAVTG
jgi:hypothetical protein